MTGIVPNPHDPKLDAAWASRWARLSRAHDLRATTPVAIALSGGADSVYLLTLVARANPRPKTLAIHVDHGLRGEESQRDAEFCARLCAKLGVPFARRLVELDPEASNLESRAREARYRALAEETTAAGIGVLLTGHHEDDAVETLLMRWMRGTDLAGLAGQRRDAVLGTAHGESGFHASEAGLRVLRPLSGMRREEVRSALRRAGIDWREDTSNDSERFTRNRVRHGVLPEIAAQCGDEGVENLRDFARAIESFEDELADRTAHISWGPVAFESARRSERMPDLGGTVEREILSDLSPTLMRRALGRLIGEGTGQRPGRETLSAIVDDVAAGKNGRREIDGGWSVQLQSDTLHLTPPASLLASHSGSPSGPSSSGQGAGPSGHAKGAGTALAVEAPSPRTTPGTAPAASATPAHASLAAPTRQSSIDPAIRQRTETAPAETAPADAAPAHHGAAEVSPSHSAGTAPSSGTAPMSGAGWSLGIPGSVQLPDGRAIHAGMVTEAESAPTAIEREVVEIDREGLGELTVRFCKPGDRFHGLGAPGHKPIRRFLGECGIPREERDLVPLVIERDTGEIVWVAGVRIAESRRVRPTTTQRLRLRLDGVR